MTDVENEIETVSDINLVRRIQEWLAVRADYENADKALEVAKQVLKSAEDTVERADRAVTAFVLAFNEHDSPLRQILRERYPNTGVLYRGRIFTAVNINGDTDDNDNDAPRAVRLND